MSAFDPEKHLTKAEIDHIRFPNGDPEKLRAERDAAVARCAELEAAGDRIVALIGRCSDQKTDEQFAEYQRLMAALEHIWNEARATIAKGSGQ